MKTINILFAVIALTLTCISCTSDDIQMKTVVNRNGSFSRTVRFESDSLTMAGVKCERKNIVNVLNNDDWTKAWTIAQDTVAAENGVEKMRYFCSAYRDFNDVSELNANYPVEINGTNILKNASLDFSFRGFYTDITFTEEYADLSTAFSVPAKYFLKEDELSYWVTGTPDIIAGMPGMEAKDVVDKLEERFGKWYIANYIYDVLTVLADSYESFSNCPVAKSQILSVRDSLALEEHWNGPLSSKLFVAMTGDSNFSASVAIVLETDYFSSVDIDSIMEEKGGNDKYANTLDEIDYQLVMPGRILSTGNGTLNENDVISYRVSGRTLLVPDFTISATSRVVNYWFFAVALLIVVIPIVITLRILRNQRVENK